MSKPEFDIQVWEVCKKFFDENISDRGEREKNQLEAYWCRPEGDRQQLFQKPEQRIFARFLRSYLNTTWHKISLTKKQTDEIFSDEDIIENATSKIKTFLDAKKKVSKEPKALSSLQRLLQFCKKFISDLDLQHYEFNQAQTKNFDIFRDAVEKDFNSPNVSAVSKHERIIYDKLYEPYKTIMKMQKLVPGFGVALTCDFLKESHLCNIAKPDIHIAHVFSLLDGVPYSMDLALVRRVCEFAATVCPANPNDFCNTGAYNVDKVIWMCCSDYNKDERGKKKGLKQDFLKRLAS